MRAFSEAANSDLQVLGVSVPWEETEPMPVHVGPLEINKFPTFILLRGKHEKLATVNADDELMRFVEQPIDPAQL
jgi:hypothetical protein